MLLLDSSYFCNLVLGDENTYTEDVMLRTIE